MNLYAICTKEPQRYVEFSLDGYSLYNEADVFNLVFAETRGRAKSLFVQENADFCDLEWTTPMSIRCVKHDVDHAEGVATYDEEYDLCYHGYGRVKEHPVHAYYVASTLPEISKDAASETDEWAPAEIVFTASGDDAIALWRLYNDFSENAPATARLVAENVERAEGWVADLEDELWTRVDNHVTR